MTVLGPVGGITDPGRKRRRNEDAYVIEPPLFAVADGMGGAQAGEVASRLAAAALKESGVERGGDGLFPEHHMIVPRKAGHQVLRPLKHEIPAKMGETKEGPRTAAACPNVRNWRG